MTLNITEQGRVFTPEWDIHSDNPSFDDIESLIRAGDQRAVNDYLKFITGASSYAQVDGFIFLGQVGTISSTAQLATSTAKNTVVEFTGVGCQLYTTHY